MKGYKVTIVRCLKKEKKLVAGHTSIADSTLASESNSWSSSCSYKVATFLASCLARICFIAYKPEFSFPVKKHQKYKDIDRQIHKHRPPKSGCGRQNGYPQGITIHHINDVINRNVNSQTTMSPLFLRTILLSCYLTKVYIATKSLNNLNLVYTISTRVNLKIFSQNTRLTTPNQ